LRNDVMITDEVLELSEFERKLIMLNVDQAMYREYIKGETCAKLVSI
jgi:hypothetical protein